MPTSSKPLLIWFRNDLRLSDNPALDWAIQTGKPIVAAFVLEDGFGGMRALGGASKWWLHKSLVRHRQKLEACGIHLVLRRGDPGQALAEMVSETGADTVVWNRRYEARAIAVDKDIKASMMAAGLTVHSFNGSLLVEPWEQKTKSGTPFRVFTPFWKSILAGPEPRAALESPSVSGAPCMKTAGLKLQDLDLLPDRDWADQFDTFWEPGEIGAQRALTRFLDTGLRNYGKGRDIPGQHSTSMLSPHLQFGEISPVQIWNSTRTAEGMDSTLAAPASKFLSEIAWREFAYHLLFHNPGLATDNYARTFDAFPWQHDRDLFDAWKTGTTGYPIVDAGMRQLWKTGWMHNRVRMVAASFLIKHLMIDWRQGEKWFWDTLVDADVANNPAGWQWVAGCGADAAPYFRIFNPVLQGEKFDSDGAYVRQWVPELSGLENKWLHKPWKAPDAALRSAGVKLGRTYPNPVVEHGAARERALAAYSALRRANENHGETAEVARHGAEPHGARLQ